MRAISPPWLSALPTGEALQHPLSCDVVIIGGGWPGLVAAARLADSGASVVLLEAGEHLGGGASARSPGLITEGLVEHPWRLASALGSATAADLHRMTQGGRDHLLAQLPAHHRPGVAWCAVNDREDAEIAQTVQTLQAWDSSVEAWSAEVSMAQTGAQHLQSGWFVAADAVVDPAAATVVLASAARQAGARLFTGAPVHTVDDQGCVASHRITAELVLLAAETGLPALDPWFAEMLSPVREQAVLLSGPAPTRGLRTGYGYTQWIPTAHGLAVAGCRFATPHMEMGESDDSVVTPPIQERLEASAQRFFPGEREVLARWSWVTARSCDGLPLVGPFPGNPRLVVCAGFMGLEGSLGIASALAAAEGMLTGRAQLPDRLSPMRLV